MISKNNFYFLMDTNEVLYLDFQISQHFTLVSIVQASAIGYWLERIA